MENYVKYYIYSITSINMSVFWTDFNENVCVVYGPRVKVASRRDLETISATFVISQEN